MRWRWLWLGPAALSGSLAASNADACEPARAPADLAQLPEPWQAELRALIAATRDREQPWGCPRATLRLAMLESGARLSVERAGAEPMARVIHSPEELVPLGKALLARPMGPAKAPVPTPIPPPAADRDGDVEPAEGPSTARARLDAVVSVRYAGVSELATLGFGGRGTLPVDAWGFSLWARYHILAAELGGLTDELDFSELVLGAGISYALVRDPVRFEVGLNGGLAVVDMEAEGVAPPGEELEVESGAVDGRIGLDIGVSIPIVSVLAARLVFDADLAPASLVDVDRRLDPLLPPLPAYTVGLSAGLEVGIP